jgi:hypothetical protein
MVNMLQDEGKNNLVYGYMTFHISSASPEDEIQLKSIE